MDQGKPTAFSTASRPMKYALSYAVFCCSFTIGIFMTGLSPAVNDFVLKFDSDVDKVSIVFTVLLVAYLVGALSGGVIFNFVNRQFVVIFLLSLSSACLFAFPHVTSLTIFYVLGGLMGIGSGGFDTAQVAWIIDIWRHEAAPFILSQHFAYSVGTLVPPLVFAPFLTGDTVTDDSQSGTTTAAYVSSTDGDNLVKAPSAELFVPFTISGALGLAAVIIQIVLCNVFQRTKRTSDLQNALNNESSNNESNPEKHIAQADINGADEVVVVTVTDTLAKPTLWQRLQKDEILRSKILVVFLACCFIGFYQAMELCTVQFLPTFTKYSEIDLSDKDGAGVLLGLNIGFAVGRAIGIVTVLKVLPQYILGFNFVLVFVGNTLLLVLGGSSLTWMRIGSVCLGVGFSTMYPAFYAYLEKYLFVNDTIAAIITVSGGIVSAIYPLIVGGFVKDNPKVLNYVDYVSFTVTLIAFIALFWYTQRKAGQGHENPKNH